MLDLNIFEHKVTQSLIRRGYAPFRPVKDSGIDFLVVDRASGGTVRLQVKGSTLHARTDKCGECGGGVAGLAGGWFDIDMKKARRQAELTDFYVFVWPTYKRAGRMILDHYIILPTAELVRRFDADEADYPSKRIWKDRFRPWFVVYPSDEVVDLGKNNKKTRAAVHGSLGDYTPYYRNWGELAALARERGQSVSLAV